MHPCKQLFRPMTFCTPAGVANAELHGDEIVGVQKNPLTEVRAANGVALCARFANWPNDPKGVLSFTRRYGVLRERPHPGAAFLFRTADWQLDQQLLRREWDYFAYISNKWGSVNNDDFTQSAIPVADGEELVHRDGKLEYKTQSLLRLLRLELASFLSMDCASVDAQAAKLLTLSQITLKRSTAVVPAGGGHNANGKKNGGKTAVPSGVSGEPRRRKNDCKRENGGAVGRRQRETSRKRERRGRKRR